MSNPYTDIAIQKIVEQEVNKVLEDIKIELRLSWLEPEDDDWKNGFNMGLHIAASKIDKHIVKENE